MSHFQKVKKRKSYYNLDKIKQNEFSMMDKLTNGWMVGWLDEWMDE